MDYPLSEFGEQQAVELAEKMKKENFTCQAVYSSDLTRASRTADILTEILELEVKKYDERLREMHLGDRQGKNVADLTAEETQLADKIWKSHTIRFPNGESVNNMKTRVKEAFEEIIDSHNEADTILIIAHGGTLYHILYHILGVYPETNDWFSNCSYNELYRKNSSDPWQLTIYNGMKVQ